MIIHVHSHFIFSQRPLIDWLNFLMHFFRENLTHIRMSSRAVMLGAYYIWAGRDLCCSILDLTRDLSIHGFIRWTTPFSRRLRQAKDRTYAYPDTYNSPLRKVKLLKCNNLNLTNMYVSWWKVDFSRINNFAF